MFVLPSSARQVVMKHSMKNFWGALLLGGSLIAVEPGAPQKQAASQMGELQSVNKVIARVNGDSIFLSDLKKTRFGRVSYTLDDAITHQLYLQEATKKKMIPTKGDIEKQVASIRSQNKTPEGKPISDEVFELLLAQEGFSLKQYKSELARTIAVQNVMNSMIREKVFVTKQEIEKYYHENPEWREERYSLKTCIVPFVQAQTEADVRKMTKFDWVETGWVDRQDIGEHMAFVPQLAKGVMHVVKTEHGFQVVKMEDRQERALLTLQERQAAIQAKLNSEKVEVAEKQFVHDLKSRAVIEYLET